jgi:hypothetical protein
LADILAARSKPDGGGVQPGAADPVPRLIATGEKKLNNSLVAGSFSGKSWQNSRPAGRHQTP